MLAVLRVLHIEKKAKEKAKIFFGCLSLIPLSFWIVLWSFLLLLSPSLGVQIYQDEWNQKSYSNDTLTLGLSQEVLNHQIQYSEIIQIIFNLTHLLRKNRKEYLQGTRILQTNYCLKVTR